MAMTIGVFTRPYLIRKQIACSKNLVVLAFTDGGSQPARGSMGQLLKKVRKGLFHAGRIFDSDARDFQPQNRKAHRHAMIVVSLNSRAVERAGMDFQCVAALDYLSATFGQFSSQRSDPFAFLQAQSTQIGEASGSFCKRRKDDTRHNAVAQ